MSDGPDSTDYLSGNDHAEGNGGGGPPEGNRNAATANGAWGDWETELKRLSGDGREALERKVRMYHRAVARTCDHDHATIVRLCREFLVRRRLYERGMADFWNAGGDGRGPVVEREETVGSGDETVTAARANRVTDAAHKHRQRRREIADTLGLFD